MDIKEVHYPLVGIVTWAATCFIGIFFLIVVRQRPSNGFWKLYIQYLSCHAFLGIWIVIEVYCVKTEVGILILSWLQSMSLLYAATVYMQLGTLLYHRSNKFPAREAIQVGFTIFAVVAVIFTYAIFVLKAHNHEWLTVLMWAYYTLFAVWAIVGCFSAVSYCLSSGRVITSDETVAGCVRCDKCPNSLLLVGVLAIFVGMIDFQLPYISQLLELSGHPPLWQVGFITRVIDSVFYVPPFIAFITWLDNPWNYPFNEESLTSLNTSIPWKKEKDSSFAEVDVVGQTGF